MEVGGRKSTVKTTKLTAAHLAGLRPLPVKESPLGKWDPSTGVVAFLAVVAFAVPEILALQNFLGMTDLPHSPVHLIFLLGVIAIFGIFPAVFFQHLCLQYFDIEKLKPALQNTARVASAAIAIGTMVFTTSAMKPLVGYDQKFFDDRLYTSCISTATRTAADCSRVREDDDYLYGTSPRTLRAQIETVSSGTDRRPASTR